jgi:hypothetical protein
VADVLCTGLRPDARRPARFRGFAFAFPVLLYLGYFGALALTDGIGWSTHLWIGVIVFSGIIGWLASYVVLPPRWTHGADQMR